MLRTDKMMLEGALREHYRRERTSNAFLSRHAKRVADLAAAAASNSGAFDAGLPEFAASAVASAPRVLWAAPATVVVLALALAFCGAPAHETEAALVASGPFLAASCLAGVVRARSNRMQELEASCLHNAAAITCVRLAALGGTGLFSLAVACAACSDVVPVGAAAAYALAPFLLSSAGGLMLARRVASEDAAVAALSWSACVCALCIALRIALPDAYGDAALWAWATATAACALWCTHEIVRWLRLSAEGGCPCEIGAQSILS